MEALANKALPMKIFLTMLLALLISGCERDDGADPEGPGAWLTLGGNGIVSAFVRFDTGETEKWVAPFTTRFGADGQSLDIILQTERCGDLQFLAVLGSSDLKLITYGAAASRARPCRLNSSKAPVWKLLTKVVNSAKGLACLAPGAVGASERAPGSATAGHKPCKIISESPSNGNA
jgi:hypothetical protein